MTGDCHAGICGSPEVRSLRATRPPFRGTATPHAGQPAQPGWQSLNVNREVLDHYLRAIACTVAHFATSTDELS